MDIPLDTEPFEADPCTLVDQEVVDELGDVKPGEVNRDERRVEVTGPTCHWVANAEATVSFGVGINTGARDQGVGGLAGVYSSLEFGSIDYVEPVEIPGHPEYPAVLYGEDRDRETGYHGLALGVADDLIVDMGVEDEDNPHVGESAVVVLAASVLDNLKQGR